MNVGPPEPELGQHAPDEIRVRYLRAIRTIQDNGPRAVAVPLLTSIAASQIAETAIATLLIQKGIFTLAEYEETSAVEAERLAVEQVKMR